MEKSIDSLYHVTLWKYSRGRNRSEARAKAEKIVYHISSMDSSLLLGNGVSIGRAEKFRAQQVMVQIQIPVGKKILFDETVKDRLNPEHVRPSERRRWNRNRWNGDDWHMDWDDYNAFYWQSNVEYVMTESGDLQEANKVNSTGTNTTPGVYEYKKNPAADSIKKKIEEKEHQLQEEKQRLKEVESRSTFIQKEKKPKEKGTAQLQWPMSAFII